MSSVFCTRANPMVIRWARTTLNIEPDRAAKRAGVTEAVLKAVEDGTQAATLAQLRALAELYKRPVAVFFLPQPPRKVRLPHDYRSGAHELTRETLLSIRRARNVQEGIRLLSSETPAPQYWPRAAGAKADADAARRWLGISDLDQLESKTSLDFLRIAASRLEQRGIQVLLHSFPREDAKAYSFADAPPIVVISTNDSVVGSRLFSLFHELRHLSRGDSGLCVTLEDTPHAKERACDEFAAQVLMPEELVRKLTYGRRGEVLADAVDQIADQLKCSKSALLIRFEELGLINAEQRRSKMRELSLRSMPTGGGRSSRTSVVVKSSGPLLTELVFRAYSRDQLGAVEAARLLNTSPANLHEVGATLGYL